MAQARWRLAGSALLGIGLVVGLVLHPRAATASGGGGCGRQVTDSAGITVTIRQFCFGPTILRVAPGETVTWINKDAAPHTVLGANAVWGDFSMLKRAARITYRFVRPGVYPYVCTVHPGMVGAIVVGDEAGLGSAGTTTTAAGPVTLVDPSTETRSVRVAMSPQVQTTDGIGRWPAGIGTALILSLIAGVAWTRMRRNRVVTTAR